MENEYANLRFAIISCGGIIALSHIRALKQIPNAQIVAMCDINAETVRHARRRSAVRFLPTGMSCWQRLSLMSPVSARRTHSMRR